MRACAGLEAHESSSLNSGVTMAGDVTAAARADREVKVAEREEDAAFGQAEEHFIKKIETRTRWSRSRTQKP